MNTGFEPRVVDNRNIDRRKDKKKGSNIFIKIFCTIAILAILLGMIATAL